MSLYADYVKERLGWDTIEVEGGFITYNMRPPLASIEEFYVRPDLRGTTLAKRLADKVVEAARDNSVHKIVCRIFLGLKETEYTLGLYLKYGFKLSSLGTDYIILEYKVED